MATTREAKKQLRQDIKSQLSKLSEEELSKQSQRAQEVVLSSSQYKNAARLSIYLSMPKKEIRTDDLVHAALNAGKEVFVPYISGKGRSATLDMLRLASVAEFEGLKRDDWGIPTLPADSVDSRENAAGGTGLVEIEELEAMDGVQAQAHGRETAPGRGEKGTLDMIVMPGVAFDVGLNRLGHGAGFYDGFLSRFCGDGTMKPFLVGLCFAEQLLPEGREVPTTNDDWIVDAVAVGDGRLLTMDD